MKEGKSNIQAIVHYEYCSIVRQAVTLIEDIRISIAKHVNRCILGSNEKVLRSVVLFPLSYNLNLQDRIMGVIDYQQSLSEKGFHRVLTDEIMAFDEEKTKEML